MAKETSKNQKPVIQPQVTSKGAQKSIKKSDKAIAQYVDIVVDQYGDTLRFLAKR